MKHITNHAYCGVVAPNSLILCVTSLPKVAVKAPYCLLKPIKKRAGFPIVWGIILGCLLLCNSTQAEEVSWKLRDYYLQQLAEIDNQSPTEHVINRGLEFRVKGEGNQFEIGYTASSNWQVAFEQLALGRKALFPDMIGVQPELQVDLNQEVEQYLGWGAKIGYRYVLEENLSGAIHLGGFNWEQSAYFDANQKPGEGEQSGIAPYVGVGLEYRFSGQASFRLNWQHIELNSDSFDDLRIRLDYRF